MPHDLALCVGTINGSDYMLKHMCGERLPSGEWSVEMQFEPVSAKHFIKYPDGSLRLAYNRADFAALPLG